MKRYSLIALVSLLIFSFAIPTQAAKLKFSDVNRSNAHFNGVYTLEKEGTITGYPGGKFKPDQKLKRSQAAVLFTRAMDLPVPKDKNTILKKYKDIKPTHDYADAIAATYNKGIFTGSNGKFNDGSLTRAQMATVLVRAYDLKDNGKKVNAKLSNIDPSHKENVKILFQHGITNQTGDFRPTQAVTRGQFSTFLYRAEQSANKKYKEMAADFIDVGQGDSILIQTTNGKNILIDAGTQSAGKKVVDYLKKKDVGKLDLVVATHPHADHIGGLIPVLNEFKVDKILDSGMPHTSQTYSDLLDLVDQKGITYEIPTAGKKYSFGDFTMTVVHVNADAKNANDASIALKGQYGKISFMLTGDAEKTAENAMVNSAFNLKSTIYKAGHHGSNTSSTQAFINQVKPEATILSYGKGNSYGHPNSDVVKRLQALGSDMYSTADSGNISVMANGVIYNVTAKAMAPSKPAPAPKPEPKPEPKPDKPKPKPEKPAVTYPININKASYEDLQEITGVGPVIAQRIIDYRKKTTFKKKTDIKKIKGIGDKRYEQMKNQIKV